MTTEKPLTPYGNYVQKLEQENAQLKEQVEELTQQVFDLNRLGANFERENKQLISDLQAANKRIAAQVIGNTEPRSLPRYP
jgi:cell division septum initiation protein DivIVA